MSIKVKLVITYIVLVCASAVFLFGFGVTAFFRATETAVTEVFSEENIDEIAYKIFNVLAEIKSVEKYHPEDLKSEEFIQRLDKELDFFKGGVIVYYDNTFHNYEDIGLDQEVLLQLKPFSKTVDISLEEEAYYAEIETEGNRFIVHNKIEYFFLDYVASFEEDEVIYYFVTDVTRLDGYANRLNGSLLLVVLLYIVIITAPILYIVNHDIIKPLRVMRESAKKIEEGNLDFEIKSNAKNEIGETVVAFEKMRLELKDSIDKQIQYEENRKELISNISHDLKTPMTSIKGYVSGILDGVANTPEKMEKYLRVIYKKSDDMDTLIDDFFLFSKLDLKKLPFDYQTTEVSTFLEEIVEEYSLLFAGEKQKLIYENRMKGEILFCIDRQKMKRAIINILQNSIKYMNKKEQNLHILVEASDKSIWLRVKDNGMGIAKEHVKNVFARFYRTDASRNSTSGGSGLGLAIVKQIIDAHQGDIRIESEVDIGTTIYITLPIEQRKEGGKNE